MWSIQIQIIVLMNIFLENLYKKIQLFTQFQIIKSYYMTFKNIEMLDSDDNNNNIDCWKLAINMFPVFD